MKRSLFFLFVLAILFTAQGTSVQAVTCGEGFTPQSGVCVPTTTGLSSTSVSDILKTLMNWLLGILGFLGVMAFVISGIQYLISAGDDDTISTAKRNMKYSIVGVIVALSGFVIIKAVDAALRAFSTTF